MDIRNHRRNKQRSERGATTVQLAVLMVPVLFGMIGFAVDLGQLYMSRGELKSAANAMALAAASRLIGTDQRCQMRSPLLRCPSMLLQGAKVALISAG